MGAAACVGIRTSAGYALLASLLNDCPSAHAVVPSTRISVCCSVPADAKLTLAGQATASTGEVREFATTLLAEGAWANYPVRAEITKDGRTLVQEKFVTLKPGETKEISIDFAEAEIASR